MQLSRKNWANYWLYFLAVTFVASLLIGIFGNNLVHAQSTAGAPGPLAKAYCDKKFPVSGGGLDKIVAQQKNVVCQSGYISGLGSKTRQQACAGVKDPSKGACNTGFAAGRNAKNGGGNGNNASGTGNAAGDEQSPDCSTSFSSPLSFIICPLVDLASGVTDFFFSDIISPLLKDVPVEAKPSDKTFQAWQNFRVVANVLLVGAMLFLVYGMLRNGGK